MKNQKIRSMKVHEQSGYNYKATPTIILKGQWLKEMGFEIGDYITVSCEEGKLHTTLPDVVEAAIQAYREDNDWLGQFLEECCEIAPSYKEKSGELYQAYRAHCMQNGEYIRSTTDFYSSMDKAGYNRIRKNTGVQVVGLKLKEGQDFLE